MVKNCCAACGKSECDTKKLLQCSICHKSSYCSRKCQAKDFATHKSTCKEYGVRKLLQAICDNDADKVRHLAKTKYILNGKVDYKIPGEEGPRANLEQWTALHQCVREEKCDLLRILCAAPGVKLEIADGDGETPLFVAAQNSIDSLKVLIEAGANVNHVAKDGWTALMMVARDGDYDHAVLLLEAGANVHLGCNSFGRTCIGMLADMASEECAADWGIRKYEGETDKEAIARNRRMLSLLERYA